MPAETTQILETYAALQHASQVGTLFYSKLQSLKTGSSVYLSSFLLVKKSGKIGIGALLHFWRDEEEDVQNTRNFRSEMSYHIHQNIPFFKVAFIRDECLTCISASNTVVSMLDYFHNF